MREREERILGDHMVLVGKEGDQLSLTEFKGGGGRQKIGCQSTVNEWGRGVGGIISTLRSLIGDQVNVIVTQRKSSDTLLLQGDEL